MIAIAALLAVPGRITILHAHQDQHPTNEVIQSKRFIKRARRPRALDALHLIRPPQYESRTSH
jgi:hypothetical protein